MNSGLRTTPTPHAATGVQGRANNKNQVNYARRNRNGMSDTDTETAKVEVLFGFKHFENNANMGRDTHSGW